MRVLVRISTFKPERARIFEILIEGLEKKAVRDAELELTGYYFRLAPGSPPRRPSALVMRSQDEDLQRRIKRVLERLREHLTPTQKERLDAVEKEHPEILDMRG